MGTDLSFDDGPDARRPDEPLLVVDVGGFEGPLDLLLDLARRQKVDLHEISMLALADQYLAFIETARTMRLELAADYLVMAAWLVYLKSSSLLPDPPKPEAPGPEELATALALRLRRLDAVRLAAGRLADLPRLGRDVFGRGATEPATDTPRPAYEGTLFDLLSAYAAQRRRRVAARVTVARREVWSVADARAALERLLGRAGGWVPLDAELLGGRHDPALRTSILASGLVAALELVGEGRVAVRQGSAFGPLMLSLGEARPGAAAP